MTPVYYVVTPSQRLKEHITSYTLNDTSRQILLAPALFMREMPRKIPPFWSKKAVAESKDVKLSFLAMVVERVANAPALRHFMDSTIGQPPYPIEAFDHWWELHEISGVVSLSEESLNQEVKAATLKLFDKTGDPAFDNWLEDIIRAKEQS